MLASVISPAAKLFSESKIDSELETEILFGEVFEIEKESAGWAYGVSQIDGYKAYIQTKNLAKNFDPPTHIIIAPRTMIYKQASAKACGLKALPMGAQVKVENENMGFAKIKTPNQIFDGFVPIKHLSHLNELKFDFVSMALSMLGTPYIWGGRSTIEGIDCSALLQLSLNLAGIKAPRNSSDQEAKLGKEIEDKNQLQRGDLVFWKAHIGIMINESELLHANAFHMAVAVEKLSQAESRIKKVAGEIRTIKKF